MHHKPTAHRALSSQTTALKELANPHRRHKYSQSVHKRHGPSSRTGYKSMGVPSPSPRRDVVLVSRLQPATLPYISLRFPSTPHYHCDFQHDRLFSLGPHFDGASLSVLTSLHLVDWLGDMTTDAVEPFPWAQLRRINLSQYKGNQSDILHLFKACPSITHFASSSNRAYVSPFGLEQFKAGSIVLSAITHMELQLGWDGEHSDVPQYAPLLDILRYISTPKLEWLSLRQLETLLQPKSFPTLTGHYSP